MHKFYFVFVGMLFSLAGMAQKKPLDHSVYDAWQSIGEHAISNNGKWVMYTVNAQQGDGELVIRSVDGNYQKKISRGYGAEISEDSRFIAFKIKPPYQQTRQARIKKRRPDEMPADSAGLVELGKDSVLKMARIKTFKMPARGSGWVAFYKDRPLGRAAGADSAQRRPRGAVDSLQKIIDSLNNRINTGKRVEGDLLAGETDADDEGSEVSATQEPSDLVLYNTSTGKARTFPFINEYYFSKPGNVLVLETGINKADSLRSRPAVIWYDLARAKADTIAHNGNEFRNFAMDDKGTQLVFVAERDSSRKSLQKFYKLWYFKAGADSAVMRIDKDNTAVSKGFTVSENAIPYFSKNGQKVFFGTAPIQKPRDTTLVDFELARLDVWTYNDDYLQPQQLKTVNVESKRSYLAVWYPENNKVVQLGDINAETVIPAEEGNSELALVTTNKAFRKQSQWKGRSLETALLMNMTNGTKKIIKESVNGFFNMSPLGKFVLWYDEEKHNYFTYNTASGAITNISATIKVPLYDEDDDHPDFPPPHGFMKWQEGDRYVYVYDKYDIWKLDPAAKEAPVMLTGGAGRKNKITYHYISTDREERFITPGQTLLLSLLADDDRTNGYMLYKMGEPFVMEKQPTLPYHYDNFFKAKEAGVYGYLKSNASLSPSVTVITRLDSAVNGSMTRYTIKETKQLSDINPQQNTYNWYTAELVSWKMFNGKPGKGILYKPENFDPSKKYPVIFYFYERDSDSMYLYRAPQPMGSTINIPYYTSNGYIVFDPAIYYTKGEPGESAYNSVVSAAKYMSKFKWVDSTKLALQGHSWGGYQIAYLVTRTNMFVAAEAGAPVANMTSAYSGIRWSTGVSREFQYERGQSRIGYSLWERPDLYLKNSPLFRADKVQTPLLMMHNDADGAVPWYQGIEYFSALKRLGKKAWLIEYNGEDHNLVERKNRKDWAIRMSQFFDHYLKGAPAPKWMTQGVAATEKGKEWGLETDK